MYKLIGSPKSRAGRVMWMLEEIGAAYEVTPVGPHTKEAREANPSGKIPALIDDDVAISDSTAILLHLADKHDMLIYPVGSIERAQLLSVVCFAIDQMEQPLWTYAKHSFVLPEDKRARDAIEPALRHEWRAAIAIFAKLLGDGPFVMGQDFTVADVVVGHIGAWGKSAGFEIPEGPVADYMTRVRARPGWRAVVKAREAS